MRSGNLLCAMLMFANLPLSIAATETKGVAPQMTVAAIVDKNVAARGGLAAWRAVQTMEMKGKMEAGGNQRSTIPVPDAGGAAKVVPARRKEQAQLPFVMDLQRGRKMRVEIEFKGQTAVQVYNGAQGWKLRPFLNRHQVENFTPEELKTASSQSELDGLLIDYQAKGSNVELEGAEQVEIFCPKPSTFSTSSFSGRTSRMSIITPNFPIGQSSIFSDSQSHFSISFLLMVPENVSL